MRNDVAAACELASSYITLHVKRLQEEKNQVSFSMFIQGVGGFFEEMFIDNLAR